MNHAPLRYGGAGKAAAQRAAGGYSAAPARPDARLALPLLIWAAVVVFAFLHRDRFTLDALLRFAPENRPLAALVMLGLFALKSVTVVLYAGLLYAASGILFPLPAAILINVCGAAVMALVPYAIGRRAGAEFLLRLREKYPRLNALERMRSGGNFWFALLLRAVRVVPFDVGSLYLGAARMPPAPYLLGSVTGALPSAILYPVMGANLDNILSPGFLAAAGIQLLFTAASVLFLRRRMERGPVGGP